AHRYTLVASFLFRLKFALFVPVITKIFVRKAMIVSPRMLMICSLLNCSAPFSSSPRSLDSPGSPTISPRWKSLSDWIRTYGNECFRKHESDEQAFEVIFENGRNGMGVSLIGNVTHSPKTR